MKKQSQMMSSELFFIDRPTPEKETELLTEIKKEVDMALFDEMRKLISDTYRIEHKNKNNEGERINLLSSVQKVLRDYLLEYTSIRKEENIKELDIDDKYWVIFALADIINRENLSEAFVKLQQEGELRWTNETPKTRTNAQRLAYRKLSRYNPSKLGWELPEFESFRDFHNSISDLVHDSIKRYEKNGQPTLILEMAYEILESKRQKMGWPERVYPTEETYWYNKS